MSVKKKESIRVRNVSYKSRYHINVYALKDLELDLPKFRDTVHWHDYFEMELVDRGRALHRVNGDVYPLSAGDIYLLTPADLHTLYPHPEAATSKIDLTHVGFHRDAISEDIFRALMELRQPLCISCDRETCRIFLDQILLIREEGERKGEGWEQMQKHLLRYLLLKFIAMAKQAQPKDCVEEVGEDTRIRNYLDRAIAYIKMHFRDPHLNTACVAEAVELSCNYFGDIFRKHMGQGCADYIRKVRLDFAMNLLSDTQITVSQVAEKSGYTGASYFIRDFKAHFGKTPQQYRTERGLPTGRRSLHD